MTLLGGGGKGESRSPSTSSENTSEPDEMSDFIKVSRHDAVNRVGGKIAWNARRGESHPIIASGAAAIYKAMAAIAAARRFLEKDDLELVCQPAFRAENKAASLAIYFSTVKQRYRGVLDSKTIISVNKTSQPQAVAGAISARIRENLNPLITAIGEEAVCNAVMAMSRTRIYLEEDRLDIRFVAIEEEMELKGGDGQVREMNAMRFRLYGEQVEADTSGGGDD